MVDTLGQSILRALGFTGVGLLLTHCESYVDVVADKGSTGEEYALAVELKQPAKIREGDGATFRWNA